MPIDHGRALAVLGDAEAVIDRGVATGRVKPRRGAHLLRRHAANLFKRFRRVLLFRDELRPSLEVLRLAALAYIGLVDEPFGDDDMRHGVDNGDVGAGLELQMMLGLHMRRFDEIDLARIDDDQPRAFAEPLLHARGEDRMRVGRVGADDDDHVGLLDRHEILRAGGGAEGRLQPVACRGMANPRAGIDVVVLEGSAHQLLDEIGLLVGAARGGDAADSVTAVFRLEPPELLSGVGDRLLPAHLAPGIGDLLADHRLGDAILVRGIAPGEAALHAGMALVRLAVLVGHHAHDRVAAHLRLERAADAAIGAGCHHRMLRLADLDQRLLRERRGRAGLHAGAAGDAFGRKEAFVDPRRHLRFEAAAFDGQREGALHFLAGAHTARADDALRRIEGEIGIRLVLRMPLGVGLAVRLGKDVVRAVIAVAHFAQANGTRHVLQLAIAVRGTGQTVERMVGDIELHHPAADAGEPLGLRMDGHPWRDRRCAGGRRAGAAFDLHQAEAARAERVEHVGRAEFRDLRAGFHRRTHDRRALRHGDGEAVYRQGDEGLRFGAPRAVVDLVDEGHCLSPIPQPACADAQRRKNPRGNG